MVNLGFRASRTRFLQDVTPHAAPHGRRIRRDGEPLLRHQRPRLTAAALTADEVPVLRHLDENHVVPELQLIEGLHRLMMAADAEAMHSERWSRGPL